MSVTAGLTATKAALDIAKAVMDKLNTPNIDVHGVRAGVQEMLIHLVNAQVALGEANVEISDLRQQIASQEALSAVETDLQFQPDGGFYVRRSDGAICCPACWGDRQKVVPMAQLPNKGYRCAIHNAMYRSRSAREEHRADESHFEIINPRRPWG